MAKSLPRDELLSLYGCCDVFLSLHRSEGFGRGLAEALQLGVDEIATGFGGNTDFCAGSLAHPVRWRKAPNPRGSYPHADGHSLAEPDLDHAALLCQQVAARRSLIANEIDPELTIIDTAELAMYLDKFLFARTGALYRERLDSLWSDRKALQAGLRWKWGVVPLRSS